MKEERQEGNRGHGMDEEEDRQKKLGKIIDFIQNRVQMNWSAALT